MLVEQREKEVLCNLQSVKSNNKTKKTRKRSKKPMISVVQQLFQTCKEVFGNGGAGFIPSPQDIEKLRLILDGMKAEDVGLSRDLPYFRKTDKKGAPPITYQHVYECKKFSIGIFCLPPSGVIPLHNHPGMTVFSKLLFGSMHIKSYDWVKDASDNTKENLNPSQMAAVQPPGTRLAKVNTDSVFTAPCNTNILYPASGGNLHCFTAVTACAVIDVLGPPYSDPEGRHCMYYRDVPPLMEAGEGEENAALSEGEKYAWLEEKEKPDKFFVVGALYRGPKIIEI